MVETVIAIVQSFQRPVIIVVGITLYRLYSRFCMPPLQLGTRQKSLNYLLNDVLQMNEANLL